MLLAGCSGAASTDERVGTSRGSIAYGTADVKHTAVVSVLAPVGSSSLQECSGSIVKVANGIGSVLTAAHCCNTYVPTLVVVASDYAIGENDLGGGGTPSPPVYPVVPGSVFYDAQYTGNDHDFCLLSFSGATAAMATLALPTSANDGLTLGSEVEHVGFGMTESSTTNSGRRSGIDTVDTTLTSLIFEFSQGGATHVPGTCDGDSGGPSLLPAGASQSQQVVVGVQSYGNASSCVGETLGGASRVSSEIGAGGFIASYLAGSPIGVRAGGSPPAPAPAGRPWTFALLAAALVVVSTRLGPLANPS
jgi:secreted trypsin-like serine protease